MFDLPGVPVAQRPLHFWWIADCSGSMSEHGKIEALNNGIRAALPAMRRVAGQNPNAQLMLRAVRFSHGASWHVEQPTPIESFQWQDLQADELQRASVDVVFMIDTSGSMTGEIEAVKRSCVDFADQIAQRGANVRLGLVGFAIGSPIGTGVEQTYTMHRLSKYTVGVWPLAQPDEFKRNVQSLRVGFCGGGGCYLANADTVDMFPHVVENFTGPSTNKRVLVIISDEMGSEAGVGAIVDQLKAGQVKAHVMGVPGGLIGGAHKKIASRTGGQFWDITRTRGAQDFSGLLESVAETIAREVTQRMADGTTSLGTDMGAALRMVSNALHVDRMPNRALPPVLVMLSDGQPSDDFQGGLDALMAQPWGRKSVRLAIAIGRDAELSILQRFIGHSEIPPLQANNPEALVEFIKWASTAVVQGVSTPSNVHDGRQRGTPAPIQIPVPGPHSANLNEDVW